MDNDAKKQATLGDALVTSILLPLIVAIILALIVMTVLNSFDALPEPLSHIFPKIIHMP